MSGTSPTYLIASYLSKRFLSQAQSSDRNDHNRKGSLRLGLKIVLIVKISARLRTEGRRWPQYSFVYPDRYRPAKDFTMELTSRIGKVVHHEINSYDR